MDEWRNEWMDKIKDGQTEKQRHGEIGGKC